MWSDIHGLVAAECQRPEAVEETPRSNEAPVLHWKRSRDLQRAQSEVAIWIRLNACVGGPERHTRFSGDGLGAFRHCARIWLRASSRKG
jgi:hypothetical protein